MKQVKKKLVMLLLATIFVGFNACKEETLPLFNRDAAIEELKKRYANKDDYELKYFSYTKVDYDNGISEGYSFQVTYTEIEMGVKYQYRSEGVVYFYYYSESYGVVQNSTTILKEELINKFDKNKAIQLFKEWCSDYYTNINVTYVADSPFKKEGIFYYYYFNATATNPDCGLVINGVPSSCTMVWNNNNHIRHDIVNDLYSFW
jgi:hypothetical protein